MAEAISSALRAEVSPALGGARDCCPLPHTPIPASPSNLRFAAEKIFLTKPNTSFTIEMPASLRSEGVRVHPGMPFGFLSESAFGFAGMLTDLELAREALDLHLIRVPPLPDVLCH